MQQVYLNLFAARRTRADCLEMELLLGLVMFRRILVPHDFSPHAEAALDLAIELAGSSKARIHLVHLFHIPMEMLSPYEIPMPPALVEEVRAAASARLEAALSRVRAAGLAGDAEVDSGLVAEMIVERAAALGVDLIAMGTHGHSGLKHLLLGSVAERVLRTAPCPVLTVRGGASAAPDGAHLRNRGRRILT